MIEVVLDTETTGLSVAKGHRIVEIGCIELENQIPTDKTFHCYLNPQRKVSEDAIKVHGYTDEFLSDKKKFSDVVDDFLKFIENKMYKRNDIIIFLKTKKKDVDKRLKKRKNFNPKLLNILRKSQLTLKQKKKRSNYILVNNYNSAIMKRKVKILKTKILNDRNSA